VNLVFRRQVANLLGRIDGMVAEHDDRADRAGIDAADADHGTAQAEDGILQPADRLLHGAEAGGVVRVAVHAIAESDQAKNFRDNYIEPLVATSLGKAVDIIPIGPVIGAHVGPAVAVVYETTDPLR
jgi:hypothetical protein